MKTSYAQLRAVKKYDERHPDRRRHNAYKSHGRLFLREYADQAEIYEFLRIMNGRVSELKKNGRWSSELAQAFKKRRE